METVDKTEQSKAGAARKKSVLGPVITILGGCFWGLSGVCGQYLFDNKGVTVRWLIPLRLMIAGLTMLSYYLIKERKKAFRIWTNARDTVDVLIYGLAGITLCQYTYFATIELSNAGTAAVLQYVHPVIVLLIVCFQEKRKPKIVELAALFMAVFGIFLIATHGNIRTMAISGTVLFIGLLSAVTVVIYNMQPKRLMMYYPTPYLLAWGMTAGGMVLVPMMRPWQYSVTVDLGFLGAFFGVVFLGSIVGFCLYMHGVKLIGPARASLYASVEPLAATILSAVWLKVPFQAIDLVGFAFIIGMIFLLGYAEVRKGTE